MRAVEHAERHASASATTWSMSTLDGLVRVTASYWLNQLPDVG